MIQKNGITEVATVKFAQIRSETVQQSGGQFVQAFQAIGDATDPYDAEFPRISVAYKTDLQWSRINLLEYKRFIVGNLCGYIVPESFCFKSMKRSYARIWADSFYDLPPGVW